jgi:hypothetical protein
MALSLDLGERVLAPRKAAPRSIDTLDTALPDALDAISPDDAPAWLRHCGDRSV